MGVCLCVRAARLHPVDGFTMPPRLPHKWAASWNRQAGMGLPRRSRGGLVIIQRHSNVRVLQKSIVYDNDIKNVINVMGMEIVSPIHTGGQCYFLAIASRK